MTLCSNCGEQNPDRFRYCGLCGKALPIAEGPPREMRKTVTVVFTDVVESTKLGEQVDPESLRRIMTRYFEEMGSVLQRHGGTVEKYIGDAVMSVFGVPRANEDDALRAVRAAVEMRESLDRLNEELESTWGVRITARTGVNTGEVVAGDPSRGQAFVLGDTVNVAARLEQAAEPGGILIGDATYRLVKDAVIADEMEPVSAKGKAQPVRAWKLVETLFGARGVTRRQDSALVGREKELTLLNEALQLAVQERTCELVTVLGTAGVGKSRLAGEFTASLGTRAAVVQGRCLPYGEGITFWPVAEVIRDAAGIGEREDPQEAIGRIGELLPPVGDSELIRDRVAALLGLAEIRPGIQETFWALRRFLEALARSRPLVVLFDDIHWAEPTFLDLIEYLTGRSSDASILLVCMARPDLLDMRPDWGTSPNAMSINLEPLTEEETRSLMGNLLGSGKLDHWTEGRLAEAAEGNPLFMEELLRVLTDDGSLRRDDGRWVASVELSDLAIPPTIQALLTARLDRLGSEERAVLQRASVVGKVFWWGAVSELTPEAIQPEVGGHLQTLVRKDLIAPEPSSFARDDAFRFRHLMLRDAAYEGMPKGLRADLHARFASWLEREAADRTTEYEEILGYHLEQAHRYRAELGLRTEKDKELARRAAVPLASAGGRAFALGDIHAAVNLLGRASSLLPRDDPERLGLLPDLGEALTEAGDLVRAQEVLGEAVEVAGVSGDRRLESHATIVRLLLQESMDPEGRTEDALREVERAIPIFEAAGDELGLAKSWRLLADVHFARSQYAEGDLALQHAISHARKAGDAREEAEGVGLFAGSVPYGPVPVEEAIRRCEEILAGAGGSRTVEARTLRALAGLKAMVGQFEEARSLVDRARTIFEDLGLRLRAGFVSSTAGFVEMLAGDPVTAERELLAGYETMDQLGERGYLATVGGMLAQAIYAQGRYDQAEKFVRISKDAAASDDIASQVIWRSTLAKVLANRDKTEEAEALAREAVEMSEETDDLDMRADALMDLAEVLRLAGKSREAIPSLEEAHRLYDRKGNRISADKASFVLGWISD